uniref:hypothetical protein n=1 Tax=Acidocella sp. TaxID=50710 RepID=UPI002609D936
IRWEGFHRRPEINQSLLRWREANSDPDVESKTTTRSGGGLANSIVPMANIRLRALFSGYSDAQIKGL